MAKQNGPEVPSTSGEQSDNHKKRAFGKAISRRNRPRRSGKRKAEPQCNRRHGAFAQRRDFWRDPDLIWFFQQVGKGGERKLQMNDLRRWRRVDLAVSGLWRLCLYFTNPRGFARPLVAPLVEDDGRHDAEVLYGLPADERAELLHKRELELESRKLYATQERRGPDYFESAGLKLLEKDYTEYMHRRATSARRAPEAIVPREVIFRLVRTQFEYRRPGEYPTADSTANVIRGSWRAGEITWSTWLDYAVNPHGARMILHKRKVNRVEDMSDQQLIAALNAVVAEEARQLEADEAAAEAARAAKAERARGARRRPTISDWFSSTLALDLSVVEIARAAKLPQRDVRQLLMAQGCPGVTVAGGEPTAPWLNDSDAGRAFKDALAAAAQERRQSNVARRA